MTADTHKSTVLAEVLGAHRALLGSSDVPRAVTESLAKVGRAAAVDRAYIFEITGTDGDEFFASQRYEWASESVDPQIDNPQLQNFPLRAAGYSRWLDSFLQFRPIYGNIDELPAHERPGLEEQGIVSILIVPIFANSQLWGFVGFDDCLTRRVWIEAEVDLLVSLTVSLGFALSGSGAALDSATTASLAMVGRLLDVHSAMFSDTPMDHLMQRTQARVRILIEAHRYLIACGSSKTIAMADLLHALTPHFDAISSCGAEGPAGRIQVSSSTIALAVDRALDVVIVLADVLAVIACNDATGCVDLTDVRLGVSLQTAEGKGELTITAMDKDGTPTEGLPPLDGMAHVLLRRVQEQMRATIVRTTVAGLLFRLQFPVE
ncbi:MAG: GAF domain-containing protein [Spirochaetaceae bacterium]|nr:MAG: GAF domain-containing protein [Spirochaetaceae bacterium]